MKKIITDIRTLAALLIASATFVACSGDNDITADQPALPAGKQVYTMTVNAVKGGNDAVTRALALDGKTLNRTWATTENVYVKDGDAWLDGSLQPRADGPTTTLEGSVCAGTINAGDVLALQTPRQGVITYDGQNGTLDNISQNYDYATASVTVASVSDEGAIALTENNVTFQNQQSIMKFTLVDKADGTTKLNASELVIYDGPYTFTVTPDEPTSELYVAFPGVTNQTVTMIATVGNDIYYYENSNATIASGQYYAVTVGMTKETEARADLSMLDCAGNPSSRWTANCYMVHTAGQYKLPLVYGNAIKNGATNSAAYTGVAGENTTQTFPRHDGEAITAPWIKDNGITVAKAELLWQDAEGLVTDVAISGDYLTLTVGKDATTQEGNALVAVKDGNGDIVWSWHIWVTTQTYADPVSINTGDHIYQVTNVNLGWVGNPVSQGTNTFYQWGRKDPFKGTGEVTYSEADATIADNIKNPTTFYYNSRSYGPSNTLYYNMWDAQDTAGENVTSATVKTVYDPCPPGFCVPTGNLYYYAESQDRNTSWDDTNKGRTWSGIFFPAAGYRKNSSGAPLGGVGTYGYYWSASPCDGKFGRGLDFTSGQWLWGSCIRALGFSVRPVVEE